MSHIFPSNRTRARLSVSHDAHFLNLATHFFLGDAIKIQNVLTVCLRGFELNYFNGKIGRMQRQLLLAGKLWQLLLF